jgi:hypothetical protein
VTTTEFHQQRGGHAVGTGGLGYSAGRAGLT